MQGKHEGGGTTAKPGRKVKIEGGESNTSVLGASTGQVFENAGNPGIVNLEEVFPTADQIHPTPFDPRMIVEETGAASSVSIAGMRGTGKTSWTRWALRQLRGTWPFVMIIGETAKNKQWNSVPDTFSLTNLDKMDDVIGMLIARQERFKQLHEEGKFNRSALLILDDVLGRADRLRYSHNLDRVLTIGRHMDIGVWTLLQQPTGYTPMQRANVDWMVMLRQNSIDQVDVLRKTYLGMINGTKEQYKFIFSYARGWNSLVIGNRLARDIKDKVFTVTAPESVPDFKLGSKELWEADRRAQAEQMKPKPPPLLNQAYRPLFRPDAPPAFHGPL